MRGIVYHEVSCAAARILDAVESVDTEKSFAMKVIKTREIEELEPRRSWIMPLSLEVCEVTEKSE